MLLDSLEAIVRNLNRADARYLIAGGLAVNAHGYTRATHDVDLVIHLETGNLRDALSALSELGYKPLPPVPMMDFLDPGNRATWIREKKMTVFPLASDEHPQATIDIFVDEPFDFDREYQQALLEDLMPGVGLPVRFVSLDTLIAMKQAVGRHRDLDDIEHLMAIKALTDADTAAAPHDEFSP